MNNNETIDRGNNDGAMGNNEEIDDGNNGPIDNSMQHYENDDYSLSMHNNWDILFGIIAQDTIDYLISFLAEQPILFDTENTANISYIDLCSYKYYGLFTSRHHKTIIEHAIECYSHVCLHYLLEKITEETLDTTPIIDSILDSDGNTVLMKCIDMLGDGTPDMDDDLKIMIKDLLVIAKANANYTNNEDQTPLMILLKNEEFPITSNNNCLINIWEMLLQAHADPTYYIPKPINLTSVNYDIVDSVLLSACGNSSINTIDFILIVNTIIHHLIFNINNVIEQQHVIYTYFNKCDPTSDNALSTILTYNTYHTNYDNIIYLLKIGCTITLYNQNITNTTCKFMQILYNIAILPYDNIQRRMFLSLIRNPPVSIVDSINYYLPTPNINIINSTPTNDEHNSVNSVSSVNSVNILDTIFTTNPIITDLAIYENVDIYNILDNLLYCFNKITLDSYRYYQLTQLITNIEKRAEYNKQWILCNIIGEELYQNTTICVNKYLDFTTTITNMMDNTLNTCCICYDNITHKVILSLQCPGHHTVCTTCLNTLAEQNSTCPMCRHAF